MTSPKRLAATGSGAPTITYIEDVFSTHLYTGNGAAQTISNGIAIGGSYGGSVYFDGIGDYINTPANAAFNFGTGDFTIEFWYYPEAVASFRTVLDINYGTAPNCIMQPASGVMNFYTNGVSTSIISNVTDTAGSWYHYAVVRSGSTITMYRNGVSVGTTTYSGNVGNSSAACFVGGSLGGGGYYTQGYLSNFRIVKGTAVYTSAFTPPTAPLTAISGTSLLTCQTPNTVLDYSSNAFTITVTNAVAQNGGGPFTDSTANKGGMVWMKSRSGAIDHALYDTNRGATFDLVSNSTAAQTTQTTGLTSFNSNGFSIGALAKLNTSAATYASWTFRKQAKFFDVVTFTAPASGVITVNHNLGSTPGCVITKATGISQLWVVNHRSLNSSQYLQLDSTAGQVGGAISYTADATTVTFSAGYFTANATYVMYLFAHDAGGFGATGTDNVISCGFYLGSNHRAQEVVQLGYEPQFVLIKNITTAQQWVLVDNMRNMSRSGGNAWLAPNTTGVETTSTADRVVAASTGFYFDGPQAPLNQAGSTFIYIAIRRGPMRTPTSGTSVFAPILRAGTRSANTQVAVGFSPDLVMGRYRNNAALYATFTDKVRGTAFQFNTANTTQTTVTNAITGWTPDGYVCSDDSTIGNYNYYTDPNIHIAWCLRRAPGFFDIVTATTSSSGTTHSLGVKPEFAIHIGPGQAWFVLSLPNGRGVLNSNLAFTPVGTGSGIDYYLNPTTTVINPQNLYGNGVLLTSYLFATLPGVSKVGTYVGTNATLTINCGFTSGARFILIKRTDVSGDLTSSWWILDTARGIISGNDPGLAFDRSAGDVTNQDFAVIVSSGFQLPGGINALTNVSGGQYLYLAIA